MSERRRKPRIRAYQGARINMARRPGIDCLVRNLSDTGACLEIPSEMVPVDQFSVVIKPEFVSRRCRVAWRKPGRIGVQFL
jgi:hypothetical protein